MILLKRFTISTFVLVLLAFHLNPPVVHAQVCEPFAGFPSFCTPYVSALVFVPAGLSQQILGAIVVNATAPTAYAYGACRESVRGLACADAFRTCDPTLSATPLQVCRSRCESTNAACEPLVGGPLLDCEADELFAPVPRFPNETTCGCVCNQVTGQPTEPYVVDCPGLLIFNEESLSDPFEPPCMPPCLLFFYTPSQWDAIEKSLLALSIVSMVACVLALGMFLITGSFRRFPSILLFNLILGGFFVSLGFLIAAARGNERTWCRTEVYPYEQNQSGAAACSTSGFFLALGSMALLSFWLLTMVNLWMSVVLLKPLDRYRWLLVALGWAWPLFGCVVTLALSSMEYIQSAAFCYISLDYNGALQWTFIYTLVIINLVLTPVLIGWVIFVLCRSKQQVTRTKTEGFKKASKDPFVVRLMLVLAILFVAFTFFLAFRIYVEVHLPEELVEDYTVCALTSVDPDTQCPRPEGPFLSWMNFYLLVTLPLFVALLFGTSSVFFHWWTHRINNVRNGESFFAKSSRTNARHTKRTRSGQQSATSIGGDSEA
eukprot:CAMPEP_0177636480 /NCGR_PEP_ID=MMETSP0447-20121125/4463_1 /TAXON_ID=0 /ORGANISM="Stygamoeba regulata, Strain BSH-02190019" /LENGTH=545 /DNA_ID=CAMNT_0019138349 /DNA_START=184 /DNA_END=1821 /DNA_ORIENTATION=-